MKALVYAGPERMEFRDVPDPEPGPGECLVRVESVGICGSDMHAYLGHDERRPPPLTLGHEAAGTIVGGARDGERVTVNPLVACGRCDACKSGRDNICARREIISMPPRQGAFAEYVAMPGENLLTVPDDVPFGSAALVEPLACGWHALRLAGEMLRKDWPEVTALVIGGGAIGVGAALGLRARGALDVAMVEPDPARREAAAQATSCEAAEAPNPERAGGFDLVVDAVGLAATRAAASAATRPGGVIAHIGLGDRGDGLDTRRMTLQEIAFVGTYTYTARDFRETADALFSGRLGDLGWTETRNLEDGGGAFADIRAGRVASPKIVLVPPGRAASGGQ